MESLAGVRTKRKGSSDSVLLFWGVVIHSRVRICNVSYGPSGYHDKYLGKDFLERISSKRTVCLGQKIPPERLWMIYQRMELIQAGPQCCVRISSGSSEDLTNVLCERASIGCLPCIK